MVNDHCIDSLVPFPVPVLFPNAHPKKMAQLNVNQCKQRKLFCYSFQIQWGCGLKASDD